MVKSGEHTQTGGNTVTRNLDEIRWLDLRHPENKALVAFAAELVDNYCDGEPLEVGIERLRSVERAAVTF